MNSNLQFIKEFLEEKSFYYNHPEFIETDPILVPHLFDHPNDIEIAAFLTSVLAWGQRKTIISKAKQLLRLMDNRPYDFICHAGKTEIKLLETFTHRTFNGTDMVYFYSAIKHIIQTYGSLRQLFENTFMQTNDIKITLQQFRKIFFSLPFRQRTAKHIPDIGRGSTGKRLNLFMRWMVRCDHKGVDFGLWQKISPSSLFIPLDVHSGAVARKLGLLKRKSDDWNAVEELTAVLKTFDPSDPVKYDFALFGLGVFEKF
jgi:uncharacterized protein (TIGR02757 family)